MKKKTGLLITAEFIPAGEVADHYLNALQSILGGKRGYGGRRYHGHWLLTGATMAQYEAAVEFLKIPTPATDDAWRKYTSTEWTAERAIEVSRTLERKLAQANAMIRERIAELQYDADCTRSTAAVAPSLRI